MVAWSQKVQHCIQIAERGIINHQKNLVLKVECKRSKVLFQKKSKQTGPVYFPVSASGNGRGCQRGLCIVHGNLKNNVYSVYMLSLFILCRLYMYNTSSKSFMKIPFPVSYLFPFFASSVSHCWSEKSFMIYNNGVRNCLKFWLWVVNNCFVFLTSFSIL